MPLWLQLCLLLQPLAPHFEQIAAQNLPETLEPHPPLEPELADGLFLCFILLKFLSFFSSF